MVGRYPRKVTHIRIGTILAASPEAVWADVSQIASHVDWMADAIAIRFTSLTTAGVGTTFECKTKIGPFKLTDVMEITEWEPARVMGVRHSGVVTGTGRFTLEPVAGGGTRFEWGETLAYPIWLGGPVGAFLAAPLLRWVWRRNLTRLAARF